MNTNIGDYFQKVQNRPTKRHAAKRTRAVLSRVPKRLRKPTRLINKHRVLAGSVAMLMLATAVVPSLYGVLQQRKYMLSDATTRLIGDANEDLAKKLVYDEARQAYIFNKEKMPFDLPDANTNTQSADQVAAIRMLQAKAASQDKTAKVGGASAKDTQLYASQFPKAFARGATYYDTEAQTSFSLVPKFTGAQGDLIDGRLVYPLTKLPGQAIYTVEANGVKEDVVLQKYVGDTVTLNYTLKLPKTLQAKLLDTGDIGIYSADPSIYGASVLAANADMDAALKAQETAAKTHLAFVVPAPLVTEIDGDTTGVYSKFTLDGDDVAVVTTGLAKASYPLSIDPTVVVTSSSDFRTGNNEGMADLSGSGQVSRMRLSGGGVGAWSNTTSLSGVHSVGINGTTTVAHNGYMYVLGGFDNSNAKNTVAYATINTNGTVGTWATTSAMITARSDAQAVAYNGYLYVTGGSDGIGAAFYDTVEYASINSNGTVGAWQTTASFSGVRSAHGVAVYNGYIYVLCGEYDWYAQGRNDTQYAKINANGTLGQWTSTSSTGSNRANSKTIAYNGYLYSIAGNTIGVGVISDVYMAPLNQDGSVGTWTSTTSLPKAITSGTVALYAGYVYVVGGWDDSDSLNSVYYAQINANGTIGGWLTTSTFSTGRYKAGAIAYNGYLYVYGGYRDYWDPIYFNDVQYAKISQAGQTAAFGTLANDFTTARALVCSVAYNGYLYAIGGSTTDTGNDNVTTVQYSQINSSTGNNGSWSSTTALSLARGSAGCAAFNGYLYVVGGYTGAGTGTATATTRYAPINSDGTIGAWSNGASLGNSAVHPGVFVYTNSSNTYLYSIGGYGSNGGTNHRGTSYATLNLSTGAVGSWTATSSLVNNWPNRAFAMVGKYIYAYGGHDGSITSDVEYTSVNANGTLAAWQTTTAMNNAVGYTNGTTVNGCIYSVGGENAGSTARDYVQYACPAADGTISAWYDAPNLTVATTDVGVTGYNGYLYGVGGRISTSTIQTATQYAAVNHGGSGTINSWSTSANSLPAGRSNAASVHLKGYAYVIGGAGVNTYVYAALNKDGTVGTWSSAQTFPVTLTGASAVSSSGYIYVIGGNTTNVYYAKPNSNGSISSWSSTSSLPAAVQYGGAVVAAGKIYMIGGAVSSTSQTAVYVATINEDYSLGAWQTEANSLPAARHYIQPVVSNGYIYVVGGYNGAASQRTVYSIQIDSSGSLGVWFIVGNSLPAVNSGAVTLAANGYIYNISGVNDSTIYYAAVTNHGQLMPWQTLNAIPSSRSYATGVYANGYLYAFGGNSSTSVYYASVNSIARVARYSKLVDLGTNTNLQAVGFTGLNMDGISLSTRAASLEYVFGGESFDATSASYVGTLNPWGSTSTISAREGGGVVMVNGYMYYLGGYTSSQTAQVYYAKANSDGTVDAWATTTSLPGARDAPATLGFNGYIYVMGGSTSGGDQNTVYYAKPNIDGTITSWSTTATLPGTADNCSAVVMNGYIYAQTSNDVYYTRANADGTLQTWQEDSNTLPAGRGGAGLIAANGYLYVIGGVEGGTARNTVYISGVGANGVPTGFSASGNTLPAVRYDGAAYYFGGYIYYMGGQQGGFSAQSAIYYTKVNANGTINAWTTSSTVIPDGGRVWPGYTISNGYLYIVAGYAGSNKNTTYYTSVKRLWGDTVNNVRYAHVTVTIDDTTANSGYGENLQGILNGIYLDYRIVSPPSHRLRSGKFFLDGALQPLIQPNTNNN